MNSDQTKLLPKQQNLNKLCDADRYESIGKPTWSKTNPSCCFYIYRLLILFCLSMTCLNAEQGNHAFQRDLKLALKLENTFWTAVKEQDAQNLSKMVSSNFKGVNPAGNYNKKQLLSELANTSILGFGFNGPRAKRKGHTLVFTCDFILIGNGWITGPRTSVWKKKSSQWKMVYQSAKFFKTIH